MKTALTIARAAFIEHTRRRLVVFFLVASVLVTAPLVYLARSQEGTPLVDTPRGLAVLASLGVLQLVALIATIAVSMGAIGRPFATGEALTILARPVARWQFAVGRLLASAGLAVAFCVVLAAETAVIQLVAEGGIRGVLWAHWAVTAFNLVVVATIGTVLSAILSNTVMAGVLTFFVYETILLVGRVYREVSGGALEGSIANSVRVAWFMTPKVLTSPLAFVLVPDEARANLAPITIPLFAWAAAWVVGLAAFAAFLTARKDA